MRENPETYLDERQLEVALAEELDGVAPRRDLWPSVRAAAQRLQQEPQRRWRIPGLGPLVNVGMPGAGVLTMQRRWLAPIFATVAISLLFVSLVVGLPWGAGAPAPQGSPTVTRQTIGTNPVGWQC